MMFIISQQIPKQPMVAEYILLPGKLELSQQYDKKSKRTKPAQDSYTVYSSEYVEISIYNKYMEMKKEKPGVYPESEIERAKNIVRIEIRCMEGKLKALKKKHDIESISEFMSRGKKIGQELYKYYLGKITNAGMICTLKKAMERIEHSEYKPKNIQLLKEFVTDCNEVRSAAECFKIYRKLYGKDELKRLVFMLNNIDTNYVTVTTADVKLFYNHYIPSPLELYNECIKK